MACLTDEQQAAIVEAILRGRTPQYPCLVCGRPTLCTCKRCRKVYCWVNGCISQHRASGSCEGAEFVTSVLAGFGR